MPVELRPPSKAPDDALALRLDAICAAAASAPLPFSGDVEDWREFAGGRSEIVIDPRSIMAQLPHTLSIDGIDVSVSDHFVGRGEWGLWTNRPEHTPIFLEVAEVNAMMAAGEPLARGKSYATLLSRLRSGRPAYRNHLQLDSEERITRYLADIADLITSIRENGYRRRPSYNGEEGLSAALERSHAGRPVFVELAETEIGLAVDADGSLCRLAAGNHRFAAACILGIKRVPAELRLFHCGWYSALQRRHGGRAVDAVLAGIDSLRTKHQPPSSETGSLP